MEWKYFQIKKLFNVIKGKGDKQKDLQEGNIPYVSATNSNNGIETFAKNNSMHSKNAITISDFGKAFFQQNSFSGTHIVVLVPKAEINKYSALFICACIDKAFKNIFSFGYACGINRVKSRQIKLPVNDAGNPDYEYMEQYTKNIEYNKMIEYMAYIA